MFKCAGGCGGTVPQDEIFCKGCHWVMTHQYQMSLSDRLRKVEVATKMQPKIGFTTDPHIYPMAVA